MQCARAPQSPLFLREQANNIERVGQVRPIQAALFGSNVEM